jgi:hypothetical protein
VASSDARRRAFLPEPRPRDPPVRMGVLLKIQLIYSGGRTGRARKSLQGL